jgi:hypothetical protein
MFASTCIAQQEPMVLRGQDGILKAKIEYNGGGSSTRTNYYPNGKVLKRTKYQHYELIEITVYDTNGSIISSYKRKTRTQALADICFVAILGAILLYIAKKLKA